MSSSSKKSRNTTNNYNNQQQPKGFAPIVAKNSTQEKYLNSIKSSKLVFALGPAGTGKSYIATSYAAQELYYRRVSKVILTRPAVEAGENLGFLPGEIDDKYAPYITPFLDILEERLGKGYTEYLIKSKQIEALPIAYMRGRSFKDCIVIVDEAQNTTPTQMKLLLTRLGDNCKCIVDGDLSQKDIRCISGLEDAWNRLKNLAQVRRIEFNRSEIVRSDLCQQIVEAYER